MTVRQIKTNCSEVVYQLIIGISCFSLSYFNDVVSWVSILEISVCQINVLSDVPVFSRAISHMSQLISCDQKSILRSHNNNESVCITTDEKKYAVQGELDFRF